MVISNVYFAVLPMFSLTPYVSCFGSQAIRRSFAGMTLELGTASDVSVVERLNLSDSFNRWKFMQNFLDEEEEADNVNEVLYVLIDNYKNAKEVDPDDSSAPERTLELLRTVDEILEKYEGGSIPALKCPGCQAGDKEVLTDVEKLLPDPVEKEDAAKGAWDTVGELLGKSSLALNEKEGRSDWNAVCMVARLMVYFGFVTGEGLTR